MVGVPVAKSAKHHYDPLENILFSHHPEPVDLVTRPDILGYFEENYQFWKSNCGGKKVYSLVDYSNLNMNLDEIDYYALQVKRIVRECVITIVRFDGSMVQRMAGRMTAIRLHTPSNTYATYEEALRVIKGLKKGSIKLGRVSP
jgi:hypothetical protein